MIKSITMTSIILLIIVACSNTPEQETGEIATFKLIKEALISKSNQKNLVDARNLLSRADIDKAKTPVLFVELESGQNGTLTPYPGEGIGQTWLAADGATLTLDQGIIKSSRGMGDDIMGGTSKIPKWADIDTTENYKRRLSYLTGNNKISSRDFECEISIVLGHKKLEIWEVEFDVIEYLESCQYHEHEFNNIYFVDAYQIVRKSRQYHSETLGYLNMERLDR